MELPFSKIVVDSRHAVSGDASNFDITLPESLTLPPNAICYCTDIAIAHLFPSLGSGPSLRNAFYWVERIGDTSSSLDYLNRALLDEAKTYTAIGLAAEIQAKVNAASVLGGGYTVTYQDDTGTMTVARPREADTVNSFWLVDDDLLMDANFQQLFATVTTPSLTPCILNYNAPPPVVHAASWVGAPKFQEHQLRDALPGDAAGLSAHRIQHRRGRRPENALAVHPQPESDELQVHRSSREP